MAKLLTNKRLLSNTNSLTPCFHDLDKHACCPTIAHPAFAADKGSYKGAQLWMIATPTC